MVAENYQQRSSESWNLIDDDFGLNPESATSCGESADSDDIESLEEFPTEITNSTYVVNNIEHIAQNVEIEEPQSLPLDAENNEAGMIDDERSDDSIDTEYDGSDGCEPQLDAKGLSPEEFPDESPKAHSDALSANDDSDFIINGSDENREDAETVHGDFLTNCLIDCYDKIETCLTEVHARRHDVAAVTSDLFNETIKLINSDDTTVITMDDVKERLAEFSETAVEGSSRAFQSFKLHLNRAMVTLNDMQIPHKVAQFWAEQSTQFDSHLIDVDDYHGPNMEKKSEAEIEEIEASLSKTIIPVLKQNGINKFDGHDFEDWFAKAKPLFLKTVLENPFLYLNGIQLYSTPSIACCLDHFPITSNMSCDKLESDLQIFFNKREKQIYKYMKLANQELEQKDDAEDSVIVSKSPSPVLVEGLP